MPDRNRPLEDLQGKRSDRGAFAAVAGDAERPEVVVMKERISALMDGELDDQPAAFAIEALAKEGEAREAWRTYHLISDTLSRGRMLSEGFTARVAAELAREPTVL